MLVGGRCGDAAPSSLRLPSWFSYHLLHPGRCNFWLQRPGTSLCPVPADVCAWGSRPGVPLLVEQTTLCGGGRTLLVKEGLESLQEGLPVLQRGLLQ